MEHSAPEIEFKGSSPGHDEAVSGFFHVHKVVATRVVAAQK